MTHQLAISQVALYKMVIPLREPFVLSLGASYHAENVVVVIKTRDGVTGFGECSPLMSVHGESIETCFVVGRLFARMLIGRNALAIEDRVTDMDQIIYGNTSIKSAIDMALYDIAAQHAGMPLYQFIGGRNDKTIITDYTVSLGDPQKMAADALRIQEQGYPAIKVKLGRQGPADVERIKAIRAAVGNDIPLRIDANQGWSPDEAVATLQALKPFGIQYCEEPIPRWDYLSLPRVRRNSPIPIMADESCGDEHDAERLLRLGACDYFNVKLGKAGGIFKALKVVALARQHHVRMQVGAFLESRLAMTAFAHFALCDPLIEHFDFDTALMLAQDPVEGGIVYEKNGVVKVPQEPGLGARIPASQLAGLEAAIV
jgi:L-Ala-D/L-Glu epimerase